MNEKLYIDCEFNGFGGELISMALVAEDGREWYGVLPEPRIWNEWVYDHVLPVLNDPEPTIVARSREEFQVSLGTWLYPYDNPTIVADWYTDLVHFFSMFAGNRHEESMAFPCKAELRCDLPSPASLVPHNALADARAIRAALASPSTHQKT